MSADCARGVPGTVRVWCAAADTPSSTQAVSCGTRQGLTRDRGPEWRFSPGTVRRASARESPCPTPVVGQRKVTDGSAVTLSLREGRRRREAPRREKQCDCTVPHVTKVSDTCTTRERACPSDRQHTAQAAHAHVQPLVTPTWFHSLTLSLSHTHSHSLTLTLTHTRASVAQLCGMESFAYAETLTAEGLRA